MLYTWRKPCALIINVHLISKDIIERKSIQLKVHHGWLHQLLQPLYLWGHLSPHRWKTGGLSLLSAGTCWGSNSGRGLWHKVCDREVDITLWLAWHNDARNPRAAYASGRKCHHCSLQHLGGPHLWTTLLPWASNAAGYLLVQKRSKCECFCSFAVIF